MTILLETKKLTKNFGGLMAVNQVDTIIEKGEIRGLIGPNGSGKTTFINLISGIYYPSAGEIIFEGARIRNNLRPHSRVKLGISRTFQKSRVFGRMSVLQNVMIGMHCWSNANLLGALCSTKSAVQEEEEMKNEACKWLKFVGFTGNPNNLAGGLSHGEQRLVEIARALAAHPKILMLDEPVAGMSQTEKIMVMEVIRQIHNEGITVLVIEHDMKVVMNICDKISVLNFGEKIAEGTAEEIQNNKKVIEAYLGEEAKINA